MTFGDWNEHDNIGQPVGPEVVVECEMRDGSFLSPMRAREIDWSHSDAVARYRVQFADVVAFAAQAGMTPAEMNQLED